MKIKRSSDADAVMIGTFMFICVMLSIVWLAFMGWVIYSVVSWLVTK